jgi:hypothetical protein
MATNPYFITARQLDSAGVWQDVSLKISPPQVSSGLLINLPADYVASSVEARTATSDGTGTGQISAGTSYVTVTSADANNIITLPAPVIGHEIVINIGATGFELRSSAPSTIAINGGTGSAGESAIAANSTCKVICVSATAWKGFFLDADSDLAKIEAAAN